MANIKISELTALTPPDAADLVPVTDSSANQTKRTTVGEIVGIVNGDVDVANDGTATISELPVSKLQDGDARQLLQTDAAGTGVEWTSNVDVPGTLDVTGATTFDSTVNSAGLASLDGGVDVDGAFTVADTSGNVATSGTLGVTGQSTLASAAVSDLTSGRVVLAGTSGELEDNAKLAFNGTQLDVDGDVVITGDLTVEGATTTLETQTVVVEDKNIELGVVASPTDVTADGGGITLKGATDKTLNWVNATDSWTSSENVDLASGKSYRINDTEVLSATALGSAVQISSANIPNGTIVDSDINAAAEITVSKLADGSARQLLQTDAAGTGVEWTSNVDVPGTLDVTGATTLDSTLTVPLGSAAAPTVHFTGDTNTGIYSPGADQLALATNSEGRLFVDSSGNVGIGAAATRPLTVSSDLGATNILGVFDNSGTVAANCLIAFSDPTSTQGQFSTRLGSVGDALAFYTNGSNERLRLTSTGALNFVGAGIAGSTQAVSFNGSALANSLVIDSSGRLLVGTSSARSNVVANTVTYTPKVQIESAGSDLAGLSLLNYSASGYAPTLTFGLSGSNTAGTNTAVPGGFLLGRINFTGNNGTDFKSGALIEAINDQASAWGASDCPTRLVFSVTADGASSPTEAMRIKNSKIINFANAPTYADNTAALAGGLVAGDVYRKSDGTLMITY